MDALYAVVFIALIFFESLFATPEDNRVVNLGNKLKLEQSIFAYNKITLDAVVLNKSVGNHGRYKNVGYDYEFFKRGFITDEERKKGLRWYTNYGYNFIYMKSKKTDNFIRYLEAQHGG